MRRHQKNKRDNPGNDRFERGLIAQINNKCIGSRDYFITNLPVAISWFGPATLRK